MFPFVSDHMIAAAHMSNLRLLVKCFINAQSQGRLLQTTDYCHNANCTRRICQANDPSECYKLSSMFQLWLPMILFATHYTYYVHKGTQNMWYSHQAIVPASQIFSFVPPEKCSATPNISKKFLHRSECSKGHSKGSTISQHIFEIWPHNQSALINSRQTVADQGCQQFTQVDALETNICYH